MGRYFVCSDNLRLQQIILNLQSNALKFTSKGGSVRIVTTYRHAPPSLMFEVIDTGCGIRDQDLNKLFKLFGFLTNSQELNVNGIGLGLYISKKLANKLGGNITVKSIFG